jgi:hemin uptake protein HemP
MTTQCKPVRAPDGAIQLRQDKKIVDSAALLGPGGELAILHEGRVYRLRRTRLGKLILTA